MPDRIMDLHTHLFNARYIPLESVISNAMGKADSKLARGVAKLLYAITDSSYSDEQALEVQKHFPGTATDEVYLERLWDVTRHQLMEEAAKAGFVKQGGLDVMSTSLNAPELQPVLSSEVAESIQALSEVDYAAEGWAEEDFLPVNGTIVAYKDLPSDFLFSDFLDWSRRVVKKAIRAATKLMQPDAWGDKAVNYLEFFLTMLKSEKATLERLLSGYQQVRKNLKVVHFMMDMQLAFEVPTPPYYPFAQQLEFMRKLQQDNPHTIIGFSAFDPRRDNWEPLLNQALKDGFSGFKFYPAMGYLPIGNKEPKVQARIEAFFDCCVEHDIPVFVHCTPEGFQTRNKEGLNAHPKHWKTLLEDERWSRLRLCLGHAGGGRAGNKGINSPGWMAESESEWIDVNNFARIVAELCTAYPNVYCELGYITELLDGNAPRERLIANIEKARRDAKDAGRPYDLMNKIAYGSDWHMPDMVNNTQDYLGVFVDIMNRPEYVPYRDKFFSENAYQYLKLSA
jgi:predicted TIM-barrel fold metal-dependent hydrolase